jgi:hypothetical protein
LKYLSISKVSIFPKSLNQILYRILHKRHFKFGAKLISNNLYVSDPEWFLFLYFKCLYFRSLKHFWDCNFNFVNVLELHESMEERKMIQWKSFDLVFHFSFNQNKYGQFGDQTGLFYTTNPVFYTGQLVRWKPFFFRTELIFTGFVRRTDMFGNLCVIANWLIMRNKDILKSAWQDKLIHHKDIVHYIYR